MKLTNDQRAVLLALPRLATLGDLPPCASFAPLCEITGLDRRRVRLACRQLRRKGLTRYERGLWTDGGFPAGAGYGLTAAGVALAEELDPDMRAYADWS